MDFEVIVIVGGESETKVFELYHDALRYIETRMAQWNNFTPQEILDIKLTKITGQTDALGVQVKEDIDVKAIFG